MKKQNKNDNAANRKSYVGKIYNLGEAKQKKFILKSLKPEWAKLHKEGYIHIHDLDAYGLTYNCLTFDIINAFPYKNFDGLNQTEKIVMVFDFLKELLAKIGNEQSGGMSFANFDKDFAYIFAKLDVTFKGNEDIFKAAINSFINWCNNMHTRMGQTSYYVTINIGLGTDQFSRFITDTILSCFYKSGELVYKPNIVFKVHKGINRFKNDPNYDLLEKSLLCSTKKMIPTYLLCDCDANRYTNPLVLSIMGCRTRVVDDVHGLVGAIGRGNIDNISINLPRLALEASTEYDNPKMRIESFKQKWLKIANATKDILIDRFNKTCESDLLLFPTNLEYKLWCEDIKEVGLSKTFKHGTLSIGFIGLSEAFEIMTGEKYWTNEKNRSIALKIVAFMKSYVDFLRDTLHMNFSLLATSGELISGRFIKLDQKKFKNKLLKKGFYTNSFHVDVDSKLPAYRKLEIEGPFHIYSNGGCISYIELSEAPLGNVEGLDDLIEIAIKSGVHYLGFNFPKDICSDCGTSGTFDKCPSCGSKHITRIRRVSGYLEVQDFFTSGKMNECNRRKAN